MNEDCIGTCVYFAECLGARVRTADPEELSFLGELLDAAEDCNNTPPSEYAPEGYKNCAVLMVAQLAVGLQDEGTPRTTAQKFFADFFEIDRPE